MPTIGASESFLQTNGLEAVTENLRETRVELQNAQNEIENSRRKNLTPITETAEETQPLPTLNFTSQSVQIKEEPQMEAIVISSEDEDEVNALPKILPVMKISTSAKRKAKRKTPAKFLVASIKHSSTPLTSNKKKPQINAFLKNKSVKPTPLKNAVNSKNPFKTSNTPNNNSKGSTTVQVAAPAPVKPNPIKNTVNSKNPFTNRSTPINNKKTSTTVQAAAPAPPPQPQMPQPPPPPSFNVESGHHHNLQNINQSQQIHYKMVVIDKSNPYGFINIDNEMLVINAIAESMLTKLESNHYISPRFVDSFWQNGKCIFVCADLATRQFLIEIVAHLPALWPFCSLAAVRFNGTRNTKRVRLIIGAQVVIYGVNFMATLARQNPELNIYEWELISHGYWRNNGDILLDFRIDPDSFAKMKKQKGYVHFGFGRLLFHLENGSIDRITPYIRRMINCNIKGQHNVKYE